MTHQPPSPSEIAEWMSLFNEEALLADGFEGAFIGVAVRSSRPALAVYDGRRCIEILMEVNQMDLDAATERFQYNAAGAWVGEHTPLYLWRYRYPSAGSCEA
jgi:hypothetical protein